MADNPQDQVFRSVAQAGRDAVRALWARRDQRETLEPPERRLLELLEQHEEYAEFWRGEKEPSETENPFLHVTLHELLEKQLGGDDPPGTRAALERLVERGASEHEARHEIIRLLVFELHQMMSEQRDFDYDAYRAKLDALGA